MSSHQKHHDANLWDKIWKDRTGKIVLYQMPNLSLFAWSALTVISLFTSGMISDVFGYLGTVVLVIWSLQEIFTGVNYFRRALGGAVMLYIVAGLFKVGMGT